jgi:hypothetical protein
MGDDIFVAPFIVSDEVNDSGIIGMNIIKMYGLALDPTTGTFFSLTDERREALGIPASADFRDSRDSTSRVYAIGNDSPTTQTADEPAEIWSVEIAQETSVEPASARLVRCRIRTADGDLVRNTDVVCSIASLAVAVHTDTNGRCDLYIPNVATDTALHKRGDVIGKAENFNTMRLIPNTKVDERLSEHARQNLAEFGRGVHADRRTPQAIAAIAHVTDDKIANTIAPDASPQLRADLMDVLRRFADVVSNDQHDLGRTPTLEHDIELTAAGSIEPGKRASGGLDQGRHRRTFQIQVQLADILRP